MKNYIITALLYLGLNMLATADSKLPRKILAMYNGLDLKKADLQKFEKDYLIPMEKAKFNVCDLKLHSLHKLSDTELNSRLKELSGIINKHGMVFTAYTYAWPRHRNPKKNADLPAYVNGQGKTIPDRFSLIHYEVWKTVFANGFRLAEASKTIPIAAVKFDIETIQTDAVSYDDKSWKMFAQDQKLDINVPASRRLAYLQSKKLKDEYTTWYHRQFEKLAGRMAKELHAINPDLSLGVMPFSRKMSLAMGKKFGTKRAPVIVDNWSMYNGSGFDSAVIKAQKKTKALSPYILFIPWLRINSYLPEYIACNAYHAASACDGYNSWVGSMLSQIPSKKPLYKLPAGTTIQKYYAAYHKANEAVLDDLKANRKKASLIPMKKIKPLVAKLDLKELKIPSLKSVGSGKGKVKGFVLRDQQTIYFNADTGENIKFEISHLAGKKRPLALQYAVFDARKNILRSEAVSPGEKTVFNIIFPKKGTGALVISGGIGGQAWYSVKVYARHIGLLAGMQEKPFHDTAYLFRGADFYVLPSQNDKDYMQISLGRTQRGIITVNGKSENIYNKIHTFKLKGSKPIKVSIQKLPKMPKGFYFQDICVMVNSNSPYLSDDPERLLENPSGN